MMPAYPSIVTVRGEILHNRHHGHTLADGQLLLCDAGAESTTGYATDVTRTWPVSGRFDARQRDAYQLVLEAQLAALDRRRAGLEYRDVHLAASRTLAAGLVGLGLLRGSPDELVASGAHAVFFPHGVGHLLGLDVHDLEGLGDRAGYAAGRARSPQFGLAYLRMDRPLAPDMTVTVEPGFYVVPALLADPALRQRLGDQVAWSEAERWIGFGGIRIEDDVRVTAGDPEVLTAETPKTIEEMEAIVGRA
jgi:Xaa-Pro aminopeptidase